MPGAESSSPTGPIIKVGDRLYFSAGASGDRSVFASDGTPAGTAPVPGTERLNPFAFVPGVDRFYFRVPIEEGTDLWASDGTAAGTHAISTINSSQSQACPGLGAGTANSVGVVGSLAFFCSIDAEHGAELWVTDGTLGGTRMVADLVPGTGSSKPTASPASATRSIFFVDAPRVTELWRSDGTEAGTVQLTTIPPTSASAA